MLTHFDIVSNTTGKRLEVRESHVKANHPNIVRLSLSLVDVVSGETKPLTTSPRLNIQLSPEANAQRVLMAIKNEASIQFFKLVARKPEAISAYHEKDWTTLSRLAPLFAQLLDFVQIYSRMLGAAHSGDPFDFQPLGKMDLRASHNHVPLKVSCDMMMVEGRTSDRVRVTYAFSLDGVAVKRLRENGQLTLRYTYPVAEWPSIKVFMEEERVQRILDAWLPPSRMESPHASKAMMPTGEVTKDRPSDQE